MGIGKRLVDPHRHGVPWPAALPGGIHGMATLSYLVAQHHRHG
ncbi:hypothetical protein [Mesorhizobium sp. B2-2-4]|nr:hypothetical protein [Mesorhizobium sp. B2-2-4]